MSEPLSVSPNPRPKLAVPLSADLDSDQCNYLAAEHNTMVDEIEKLSAWIVKHDGDPREALAGQN